MTETLSAAGVELPLIRTGDGPRLAPGGELGSVAELVNAHLNRVLPELLERLQAGEDDGRGGVFAIAPPDGTDIEAQGAPWRRLRGDELFEDPVQVGSPVTPTVVLPRAALLDILARLLDLRASEAEHADEADDLGAAAAAGPSPVDEAGRMLARAVAQRPGAPGRAEELARLDARAAELDAMTEPAQAAARRRALLVEMDVLGLLSNVDASAELESLPTLASYHTAAHRLAGYLGSDERHAMLPDAERHPVAGAPVSLDWFRRVPPPARDRTALGEALLAAATPGPEPEGEFFTQWNGRWYRVRWRRDDGNTPALLALEPA